MEREAFVTRGNVDGIIAAALAIVHNPDTSVFFVTHAGKAVNLLRQDLTHRKFTLADIGLTPRLAKVINQKVRMYQDVMYLDHHAQSNHELHLLDRGVETVVDDTLSGAGVVYQHFDLKGREPLVALADEADYVRSPIYYQVAAEEGEDWIERQSRILDWSWRHTINDDVFRYQAARSLAEGAWPSEDPTIYERYAAVRDEDRFGQAIRAIHSSITIKGDLALLTGGGPRNGLFGFGTRAFAHVAKELGARVAARIKSKKKFTNIGLRRTDDEHDLNLGGFMTDFTREYGIEGGGHAQSGGGRIPFKHTDMFLHNLECVI